MWTQNRRVPPLPRLNQTRPPNLCNLWEGCDAVGKVGISALVKCTFAIRQLAYAAPGSNDVKRIRYKQAHEAAIKDVERAFGVLKKKWAIVRTPARSRSLKRITHLMYTCIILHNMIRKEKEMQSLPTFIRRNNIVEMIPYKIGYELPEKYTTKKLILILKPI
nr:putative nuclease HARBI1 isoform X2 [Tanacetum cinerariifolium]